MSDEWATDWHHEALLRQAEVTRYREALTFASGVLRSPTMTWEQRGVVAYDAITTALSPSSEKPEQ